MAFLLDRMLIGTIRFALDKVVSAAAAEMDNEDGLRERLLEAQMRLELGEITEEDFSRIEADVVAALRGIKERREAENGGSPGGAVIPDGMSVVGASAELSGDMHDESDSGEGSPFVDVEAPALPDRAERGRPKDGALRGADVQRRDAAESKRRTPRPKPKAKPARSGAIRAKKR